MPTDYVFPKPIPIPFSPSCSARAMQLLEALRAREKTGTLVLEMTRSEFQAARAELERLGYITYPEGGGTFDLRPVWFNAAPPVSLTFNVTLDP